MRLNGFNFVRVAFAESVAKFGNCCTCRRRVDNRVKIIRVNFRQRIFRVDFREIIFNRLRARFFIFIPIFGTRVESFFNHIRVHIVSDNFVASWRRSFESVRENFFDFGLRIIFFQSVDNSAHAFDFLELRPNFFFNLFRQSFDCPTSARRINRLKKSEFFLQNNLHISCDTAAELVALSDRLIERRIFKRIDTARNRAEKFRRVSQKIYIRIVNGFEEKRGTCMQVNMLNFFTAAECFDNLRPNRTNRAKFGNLHKEICADWNTEHNLLRRLVNRQTSVQKRTKISNRRAQSVGKFLNVIRAAVAENVTLDHESFQLGSVFDCPLCRRRRFVIKFVNRLI